jgi:hypothetical protein
MGLCLPCLVFGMKENRDIFGGMDFAKLNEDWKLNLNIL